MKNLILVLFVGIIFSLAYSCSKDEEKVTPSGSNEKENYVMLKVNYRDMSGIIRQGFMAGSRGFYKAGVEAFLGVNRLASASYELVNAFNIKVGTVKLTVGKDNFSVNVIPDEFGAVIVKTYLFFGTLEELSEYGENPEFTQFQLPSGMDQDSFVIPL